LIHIDAMVVGCWLLLSQLWLLMSVYLEGGGLFIGRAGKLRIHSRVAMSTTEHVISIFRPASA
jgi:hypothetical protein